MELRVKGMGSEKYIRTCPVCRREDEFCNFCDCYPKDMSKHKHKFFYLKTIIRKKWFGLIKITIRISKCPCGKIKKEIIK